MALVVASVDAVTATGSTTVTSSSLTFAAGDLVLVTWTGELAGTAPAPAISTTGHTALGAFTAYGFASDTNFHASGGWWAVATGATTGTVTITIATQGTMRHTLRTVKVNGGINTGSPVRQTNNSSGNFVANPSVTLASSPLSSSAVVGFCHIENITAVTAAGSGFALVGTQLANPNNNESDTCEANTAPSSTTVGFTTTYANWSNIVGLEVAAAVAATVPAGRRSSTRQQPRPRRRLVVAPRSDGLVTRWSPPPSTARWARQQPRPRRRLVVTAPPPVVVTIPAFWTPTAFVYHPRPRWRGARTTVTAPFGGVSPTAGPVWVPSAGVAPRRPLRTSGRRRSVGPPAIAAPVVPLAASITRRAAPFRRRRPGASSSAPITTPATVVPQQQTRRRRPVWPPRGRAVTVPPVATVASTATPLPAAWRRPMRTARRILRQFTRFLPGGLAPVVSFPGPIVGAGGSSVFIVGAGGQAPLIVGAVGHDMVVTGAAGNDPIIVGAGGADQLIA